MSNFDMIYLPPTKQFASDEEVQRLAERQQDVAREMGAKWLLSEVNSVQKKVDF